jgi:hypothetical protein
MVPNLLLAEADGASSIFLGISRVTTPAAGHVVVACKFSIVGICSVA